MWDGLFMLLFLGIIMGTASFLAGSLPLSVALSSRQLKVITALGTGVLVGTSLIVIIPEGVETLYSARSPAHNHDSRSIAIRASAATFQDIHQAVTFDHISTAGSIDVRQPLLSREEPFRTGPDDGWDASSDDKDNDNAESPVTEHDSTGQGDHAGTGADREEHDFEPHAWIGISLILGFILMYLIDTIPQTATSSSQPQRFHVNLGQFSFSSPVDHEDAPSADPFISGSSSTSHKTASRPSSTTVGLVIHAAADGIALGASTTTASNRLSFIIFIALMIHKAPAAFGLTSVLLKQGLSKRMARTHLIVFSLAAPVGAILTWTAVHLLGLSSNSAVESPNTDFVTGVLLLFSGGTFLYVAMHTMQESDSHSHEDTHTNGFAGGSIANPYAAHTAPPTKGSGPSLTDTLITVVGMLLPLVTQFGHGH